LTTARLRSLNKKEKAQRLCKDAAVTALAAYAYLSFAQSFVKWVIG
jgi:hypothetical protein